MVNIYTTTKKRRARRLNRFPMFFAFSNEQFEKGLKKLKVKKSGLLSIGAGGFIRKTDRAKFSAMNELNEKEHTKMMKNEKYLYEMFRYELANHEYCITYDLTDTLNALGLSMATVNKNPMMVKQLKKAEKDYLKNSENC